MKYQMLKTTFATGRRFRRRGFSLLELMIVVAIIVVLVGLTLAVMTPILLKNEERSTRNVLTQLDAAVQEWERTVDRRVTFASSSGESNNLGFRWDVPFDPTDAATSPPQNFTVTYGVTISQTVAPFSNSLPDKRTVWLLELLGQQPSSRDVLAKVPAQFLKNVRRQALNPTDGEFTKLKAAFDAWGTPIVAVFPGRDWVTADAANLKDLDGTLRCVAENGFTPATTGWGICRNRQVLFVSAGPDQLFLGTGAADNIYSYGQEGQ